MSFKLSTRSIALLAVVASAASMSFGAPKSRIVPAKGKSITFTKTWSDIYLKETNPYHVLTKTTFALKNTSGLITATWKGTLRDMRTGELYDAAASGRCRKVRARNPVRDVECNFDFAKSAEFDTSDATIYLTSRKNGGTSIAIPLGRAVHFTAPEKDEVIRRETLFGADDDNNTYTLDRM